MDTLTDLVEVWRKLDAEYSIEVEKATAEGDTDKVLWMMNRREGASNLMSLMAKKLSEEKPQPVFNGVINSLN